MNRILLTGFEPFGGDSSNPSSSVARSLHGSRFGPFEVVSHELPVDGVRIAGVLAGLLEQHEPKVVLMLGLAANRVQIALERVAINALEYRIPDNSGVSRAGRIVNDGPDAIFTSLPSEAILEAWRAAGIPAYRSDSAGTYLCNQAFYLVRHLRPALMAGFVHLPCDETLALTRHTAYLPLEHQVSAVRVTLTAIAAQLEKPVRARNTRRSTTRPSSRASSAANARK